MRLILAWGSKGKFSYLQEFEEALTKEGVECKLVKETDYVRGFPSRKIKEWFSQNNQFKKLIKEFKPDAVFVDRQLHFAINTIKAKIPLFVFLRGHYWSEVDWAKKTLYKDPIMRVVIWFRNRLAEKCFGGATAVLPICLYLEKVVKEHHPNQTTYVLFEGIHSSNWYRVNGMKLEHPCVGLVQDANWWGKSKEMLVLRKVLENMPHVHFYWAGGGPFKERIADELGKYKNFHSLGRLDYPDKIREFLSEIDIYALISGMDLCPRTLNEAQLMEKPVIATNVGGIPELMKDNETGFLVKEGDYVDIIEKLSVLLNDKKMAREMGIKGRNLVKEKFSWETIAKNFVNILKMHVNETT